MSSGWYGVDFDGTLVKYPGTFDKFHAVGDPIPEMVNRVKEWLKEGRDVRIFTARAASSDPGIIQEVRDWCLKHLGQELPVTCKKDFGLIELWDDRAIQVIPNMGISIKEYYERYVNS